MTRFRIGFLRAAIAAGCIAVAVVMPLRAGQPVDATAFPSVNAMPVRGMVAEPEIDRLIVKYRAAPGSLFARTGALGDAVGAKLTYLRAMSGGAHVVALGKRVTPAEARVLMQSIAADPAVAYVEPDKKMYPMRVPNDTMYSQQWHYYEPIGGINLPAAWDVTTGSSGIVVAVIDTGILPHADLVGRYVPGYDFISDAAISNDGDGRDPDPTDAGDYGCGGTSRSSWHGTHVAGTIGAASNNGTGVAGVNWVSKILPVRVLGQCGGYTSDIVDAMRWAAGIAVPGVPANPNPARVENLSLGGSGSCGATFQSAVNDVLARGTVIVVAAGNSYADAANVEPASCAGVIAVAATTRNGAKASYSNYGSKIAIAAPGSGVLSTLNIGTTVAVADSYATYSGTSMATPHVAGVVSLMLSVNPSLTPAQVRQQLQSSARAFPTGTGADCTVALCGAGIVDAAAALRAAPPPTARVNFAAQANGGVTSASTSYSGGYPASGANNGDRRGANWAAGGGWADASAGTFPDWLRIDFASVQSISEIDVFTIQDNYNSPLEPTEAMPFTLYGITDFDVQYWNGSSWITVDTGSVSGNDKVWRKFTFAPVSTNAIRVYVRNALASYSRIAEVEAYNVAAIPSALNAALQANGASIAASSTYSANFPAVAAINGDRRGLNWGAGGGWNDATAGVFPDVLQVNFSGTKTINEVDVFTVQDHYNDPQEPTEAMTFSLYGITDFDVQYLSSGSWVTVPGGSVSGNNRVWRKFSFPTISTSSIRVNVRNAPASYSRITEIEAYVAP